MSHSHLDCGRPISLARFISKVVHFYNITRGCYFFPGHKNIPVSKYLHPLRYGDKNSRPVDSVYTTATSFCHMILARVYNTPCRKTGEFSLDISEMRPVNVITCYLKRPLRYGGYLCNQIQQNNVEMCSV